MVGTRPLAVLALAGAAVAFGSSAPVAGAPSARRGHATLAAAYGAMLDARFETAREVLAQCDDAPPVACQVLDATRQLWALRLDPLDRARHAAVRPVIDEAIAAARRWTVAAPGEADAWFYLGGALGVRVQWHTTNGARAAAARDGRDVRSVLERALGLDPTLVDAELGLGLYDYYAATVPAPLRWLGRLLLLPGGDRVRGLARIDRVIASGALLADEARYQRHFLDLWYEHRVDDALARLDELIATYPRNPLFRLAQAQAFDEYVQSPADVLATLRALAEDARRGEVEFASLAADAAAVGVARALDRLGETDRAVDGLTPIIDAAPASPVGLLADAYLALGDSHARLGEVDAARRAYRGAVAHAPDHDPHRRAARAREGLSRRVDPARAAAYRRGLLAWRLVEAGALEAGEAGLRDALAVANDPHARARLGIVCETTGRVDAAHTAYDHVLRDPAAPPALVAEVALRSARLYERLGEREAAARRYAHVLGAFGASRAQRDDARRALDRTR